MKFILSLAALFATSFAALDKAAIDAINNDPTSTWKATEDTPFKGWSIERLRSLMGTIVEPHNASTPRPLGINTKAVPASFDSREKWPRCASIKQVRDQGNCGSCWAFGAAEAFTDRYCIASGQASNPIFGTQTLVACDRSNYGCQGGRLTTAWNFIEANGLPLETCQPYHVVNDTTPACKWGSCNSGSWSVWHTKNSYTPGCGLFRCSAEDMAQDILDKGPIEAAFTVYEDFMNYKSGVYVHKTGQELGGHAIKIIGWGVENSQPYWLIANSWGTSWGEGGYVKFLRGKNECGIESNTAAGDPIVR